MSKLAPCTLILALAIVAGCAREELPPAAKGPADTHDSRNSVDWAGTYRGVLPCADCEGIDTALTLATDGSFQLRSRYLGKDPQPFLEQGSFIWNDDGSAVRLSLDPPVQFRVGENQLTRLAMDGSIMTGDLARHQVLSKVAPGILGKRWQLVELQGQPVPELAAAPHIILGDAGRVTGFGGCNSLTGSFTLDETALRIRFDNMVTTLRACMQGMETEQALNDALQNTDNYSLNGDQLSLNRARMAPLARFEAVYSSP